MHHHDVIMSSFDADASRAQAHPTPNAPPNTTRFHHFHLPSQSNSPRSPCHSFSYQLIALIACRETEAVCNATICTIIRFFLASILYTVLAYQKQHNQNVFFYCQSDHHLPSNISHKCVHSNFATCQTVTLKSSFCSANVFL